jgi:hypothetical protein
MLKNILLQIICWCSYRPSTVIFNFTHIHIYAMPETITENQRDLVSFEVLLLI